MASAPKASCVTTEARGPIADLHHRMPVVLPDRLADAWADTDDDDAPHLLEVIAALDAPRLRATPISTRVNDVRHDGPELLEATPTG